MQQSTVVFLKKKKLVCGHYQSFLKGWLNMKRMMPYSMTKKLALFRNGIFSEFQFGTMRVCILNNLTMRNKYLDLRKHLEDPHIAN